MTMKALMPLPMIRRPLSRPQTTPSSSASSTASGQGRLQTCIVPAKAIAARPPIAPSDEVHLADRQDDHLAQRDHGRQRAPRSAAHRC